MASDKRQELQYDLKELQDILNTVTRSVIRDSLLKLQTDIQHQISELPPKEETKVTDVSAAVNESKYIPIEKYAWEQTFDTLKLYVTSLDGVKNLPENSVLLKHDEESIDIKVLNLNGHNYRLRVPKLFKPITRCRLTKKSNGFSLTISKKDSAQWEQIPYKQGPFKKSKVDAKVDPSSGLMEMMKEMYQTGDEDLKRTIQEAWSKSRDEKHKE